MAVGKEIPIMLIGAGGFILGTLSTQAYLGIPSNQKAKDIPNKEQLLLLAGGIAGAGAAAYVGSMVV